MSLSRRTFFKLFVTAVGGARVYSNSAWAIPRRERGEVPDQTLWPTHGWAKDKAASVGLKEKVLSALDADLLEGEYKSLYVDSFQVFRCGKIVYDRKYSHDYGQIYGKQARTRGPLNARLTGPYNYFDQAWHPYYHGTDLHSMQSISKTVSSVILGIAITRGDFKATLDRPILEYFDASKVKNMNDRKRRITLRHVLTMTTGLDWNEEFDADDPRNNSSLMEASDDWVQYVIDQPAAQEPGKVFNYNSGGAVLLGFSFQKETEQNIEAYGEKYLFTPLGMDHFWKRPPLGVIDCAGGLFLRGSDVAKIGYLYMHDGMWDGRRIVSKDWVKQSLTPFIDAEEGFKYGFKWWLLPTAEPNHYAWFGRGSGGQRLMVFPDKDLIVVLTGWDILGSAYPTQALANRCLAAVEAQSCVASQ